MRKRRVVLLGATGSIGQSAIQVARNLPDHMEIVGMAAHRNAEGLARAAHALRPSALCIADPSMAAQLAESAPVGCRILSGEAGMIELATLPDADMVLIAIVGTAGLAPALAAIDAGKDIAIASKEILVMAGEIVMEAARRRGAHVLPIDSEHNAIFQCLENRPRGHLKRLILTCSGGPFRSFAQEEVQRATPEMALRHPTWKMGRKITVDSATLFNKGLEMIEARWLFDVPMERVDVVIHPQSIIHSMVEFVDGSLLAQLSCSDMCFPIQYAVTWPDRVAGSLQSLDFAKVARFDFEEPRHSLFPALELARKAGTIAGTMPAVLNAANEIAVDAFLAGRIPFPRIWEIVDILMRRHQTTQHPSLKEIVVADAWGRREAISALS